MTCKECKHWGEIAIFGRGNDRIAWRICNVMGDDDGSMALGISYVEERDVATHPDFGCIKFEATR